MAGLLRALPRGVGLVAATATTAVCLSKRGDEFAHAKSSSTSTSASSSGLDVPRGKESLQYTTLLRKRAVFLTGSITDESAKNIVAQLMYLELEDPGKPITMFIQSGGGLVHSGFAISRLMLNAPLSDCSTERII